jgi:excinuclease ABC subunit C
MPIDIIKVQIKSIPKSPGVYQFFDANNKILYVGKAKNLQKRLTSYTNKNNLSLRIYRMVTLAHKIEYIITKTEIEALLLEHNLIKKLSPNFNILLKDDKTYPQILISNHKFPRITKYRGLKNKDGQYFGPYIYAKDVNKTIDILRKSFLIRNCTDSEFKNRTKPCLEYQIKKCSAPCFDMIDSDQYHNNIKDAIQVLSGKSKQVQDYFYKEMQNLSQNFEYEKALIYRDKINALNQIQVKQNINFDKASDFDLITLAKQNNRLCLYISFYRLGQNYGAKPFFYDVENDEDITNLFTQFIGQFYLENEPPTLIITNHKIENESLMNNFLSSIKNKKVKIFNPKNGDKIKLIKDQEIINNEILDRKISNNLSNKQLHLELKKIFDLPKIPQKIEVYDNSHTANQNAVGVMISAGVDGFIKSGYRKFNIKNNFELLPNNISSKNIDDTAMLKQVLFRRFSKLKSQDYPDLIMIDGGKGQLSSATEIMEQLKINIPIICIAKGPNRNAGEEVFHQNNKAPFSLEKQSPILYYLQRLRDEAHRFAIMTHRKKRDKNFILD